MITRQTIKRLQKEAEGLNPDKNGLLIFITDEDGLHFNNKVYKTIEALKESEGIKNNQLFITICKEVAEKYDDKPTTL